MISHGRREAYTAVDGDDVFFSDTYVDSMVVSGLSFLEVRKS